MMFYVEDTAQIEKPAPTDIRLLILDGTTCLDYLAEEPVADKKNEWLKTFSNFLKSVFNLFRVS